MAKCKILIQGDVEFARNTFTSDATTDEMSASLAQDIKSSLEDLGFNLPEGTKIEVTIDEASIEEVEEEEEEEEEAEEDPPTTDA